MPGARELAEAIGDVLAAADAELTQEQAVQGLDALAEVEVASILARGLRSGGLGVAEEAPYPPEADTADAGGRRVRESERERCDLVLMPGADCRLIDPLESRRQIDASAGTLFEPVAADLVGRDPPAARVRSDRGGARPIEPDEAVWLELKTTGQFTCRGGVLVPNRAYAREIIDGPAADAAKLATAPGIGSACVVLVLFTDEAETAAHDLARAAHGLLDHDLPIQTPALAHRRITDRMGNGSVTACVIEVKRPLLC